MSELKELAQNIKTIDAENIRKKISHLEMIFKRKNVEKLEQGLLQAKLVLNKTDECKSMYEENKLDNCLELIKSIDYLIKGDDSINEDVQSWTRCWPYKLSNLRTIPALSATREFLTNMKIEIGGKFSLQLSILLIDDLRSFCKSIKPKETLHRIQTGSNDKKQTIFTDNFSSKITELIVRLNRCEELTSAFDLYREKSITELKSIIKIYLPTENAHADNNHDEKHLNNGSTSGSKLSRLIKEQTPAEFQSMLVNIFTHALEALRRLYGHQKLLLDISLNELASVKSPNENQHNMITQLDIRTGINEIIRIIQLTYRQDHCQCEVLSGEFLTKYLSNVLASQIKHYANAQSSKNYRNIKKKIDAEEWIPYIVDSSIQSDVNDIVSSIDIDPLSWTTILDMVGGSHDCENGRSEDKEKDEGNETYQGHRKSVVVGDKTFVASSSLLATIEVIKELMVLSINLPSIYLSNFEKLCYDALQYYNSSAMASVTQPGNSLLKTGRNLSIMGESLDCLAEFVIIVQRFYQRLSNSNRDFEPFDASHYTTLLGQFQASSNKIYMANAPPPPV
ncbi:CBM_collapsed_G0011860.mRNA.1.CDS.1 [Saccharomyces cerevisiae]|nr:CBM_collapsed_G0011860.mRNA.1.CDS.1 [Saccharomyces cerevisiae]